MTTRGQRTRATYDDYLNTPDDIRYELLDGELVMAPSPNTMHQALTIELSTALHTFVKEHALGRVFVAPFDVVLWEGDEANVVQPDLLFVSAARLDIITEANVQGAPDLVAEILSPSTESVDRGNKRDLYARHGVGEYWLVDPEARTVTVLMLGETGYETAGTYEPGQALTSPTLDGLTIDVGEVFP